MPIKRSKAGSTLSLQPGEQDLIKHLLRRYQDSLDILREPRYNELSKRCDALLRRVK